MQGESPEPKLFTVQEAERVLEQIRPLVDRMLKAFADIREEIETSSLKAALRPGDPELVRQLESRGVAPRLLEEINGTIRDIQSFGCVVNGPEAGLVDFPCLMGQEIVFLCWKVGEPRIEFWHRIPDGFAGRRALLERDGSTETGPAVH